MNKPDQRPPAPAPSTPPRWPLWLLLGGAVLGAVLLFHPGIKGSTTRDFSYSAFVSEVTANKVSTATISSTGLVTGKLDNGAAYTSQIPTALNDNAPAIALSCTVLLVLGVFAFTLLLTRRRDVDSILQADQEFSSALLSSQHALTLYQEQRGFVGSLRWQVYLAACRELCFYLLGTDQVEKNFATRLRAAGP